jgi:hypothetical protein
VISDIVLNPDIVICLVAMSAPVAPSAPISVTPEAWSSIRGGYDLQVHVAPDVIQRRIDDLDLAREFQEHGLRGFVLKSHYIPTAERAKVVSKAVPGIRAYGAITLNHAVGGLNPVAVEIAGRSGCKIVWMPTVDAENETAGLPTGGNKKLPFWAEIQRELAAMGISPPRMSVLDGDGNLVPQARLCLELIGRHDMILATGQGDGTAQNPGHPRRVSLAESVGRRTGAACGSGSVDRTLFHHHVHRQGILGGRLR